MTTLILLPHQLYEKKYLPKVKEIIFYEHPFYFSRMNFNKKKLILHRASMKMHCDELNGKYIEFDKNLVINKNTLLFDPIDKDVYEEFKKKGVEFLESPNFLLTKEDYEKYRSKTDKFTFSPFYFYSKKINNIIPNVKSKDQFNREVITENIDIPELPSKTSKKEKEYIQEAIEYIEKHFKNNYGNTENFNYPITHKTALKWLKNFVKDKFENFGKYQDFIDKDNLYLFHSLLSSSINIGLLQPLQIIEFIRPYEKKININSYEGYIRQLYWREYQRYCYIYCDFNKNYFGLKKKLGNEWYTGNTGTPIVDDLIKLGFDTGYIHHIGRLMVIGNFMVLNEIDPEEGYKWFMEFSIDSYEWVMKQNVLDMVFCVTGGETMRKPYISSSNYVLKMSNYDKGKWASKWDKLYYDFQKNHKDELWKFRYHFPYLRKL